MTGYALFGTAIGTCGIAWNDVGIAGVEIPEARAFAGATETPPPPDVARVVERITGLLDGRPDDLADVVLDLSGVAPFDREVYTATRAVPPGETATYGEIAARIGRPDRARAVGQALGRNPFPLVVPCHRVVGADGRLVGFSADGGVATKLRILALEGAGIARTPSLFDDAIAAGEL